MRTQSSVVFSLAVLVLINTGVLHANATKFVITGSSSQAAGTKQVITIRADSAGVPAASYSGIMSLIFSGSGSYLPINTPRVTDVSGSAIPIGSTISIRFVNGLADLAADGNQDTLSVYRAGADTLSVSDGTISSPPADRLSLNITPGALDHFDFDLVSPQTNGVVFVGTNTLTARDPWENAVTSFNASATSVTLTVTSLSGALSMPSRSNVLNLGSDFSSGVAVLNALGMKYTGTAGSGSFVATGGSKTGTSATVTILAGAAKKFVLTGSSTQIAGTPNNLTITALDTSGNTATGYTGVKTLSFWNANASPDGTSPTVTGTGGGEFNFSLTPNTPITFLNGVAAASGGANGAMRLYRMETVSVSVSDGTISSSGSDRLTVTVSPGPLGQFTLKLALTVTNNTAFTGADTLRAEDEWGNTVTSFDASLDKVTISPVGLSGVMSVGAGRDSVLNLAIDFSSGVANLSGKLKYTGISGTGQFKATSQTGKSGTSGNVTVNPGTAKKLVLRGSTALSAGVANALIITAQDTSGNTATGYTGAKTLSFTNASASPDGKAPTVTDNSGAERNFSSNTPITFSSGVAAASGGSNGVMRLYKVETANVTVGDGTISSVGSDRLTVTITPAGLGRFTVVFTSGQTNGIPFTGVNSITAVDSFGNTATNFNPALNNVTVTPNVLSGTVSGLGVAGNNVLNQAADFSLGVADLTGKIRYTGTFGTGTFTATSATGSKTGISGSVTIAAGSAARLVITGSGSQVAGAPQNLTITAKDSSGNTVTAYSGDKQMTFGGSGPSPNNTYPTISGKDGVAVQFGAPTTIAFSSGVAVVGGVSNGVMTLCRAGRDTVGVTEGLLGSGGADRLIVQVTQDALFGFAFVLATPQQSGIAFTGSNTLTAQDRFGNVVTTFNAEGDNVTITPNVLVGSLTGLGSAGNNVLNRSTDFVNGAANLTGSMRFTGSVGSGTFTANSGTSKNGVSGAVAIVAGGATRLVISGSALMTAGGPQSLTITAKDASGNSVPGYVGTKMLVFSGADSALSPGGRPTVTNASGTARYFGDSTAITFTSGIAQVNGSSNGVMRLFRAQTVPISVTDGTVSSSGSDQLTVAVNPAALGKFAWILASPQINGVSFTGTNTLTAQDDWGNTITSFDASSPANNVTIIPVGITGLVSGLGSGGNNVLNQANDFVSGVATLSGKMKFTGTTGSGTFTATGGGRTTPSSVILINSGATSRFVVRTSAGDSVTTMLAGTTRNLVISARDGSGNTVIGYTGSKLITFSGADSSLRPATAPTVSNSAGVAASFGVPTAILFTNGVAQVSGSSNGVLKLYRAQAAIVVASDGTLTSGGNDRLSITVNPAALEKFSWRLASPQVNGAPFGGINTLTVQDAWGNTVPSFDASVNNVAVTPNGLSGTVSGLGSGSNNILNRPGDFSSGVANLSTLGMKFFGTVGTGSFTATSALKGGTSDSVTIIAGQESKLVITGSPTQTAGTSNNLTISAKDAFGNTVQAYQGKKVLKFSGANTSIHPATRPTITDSAGQAVPFGSATVIAFRNGTATVNGGANGAMKLLRAETATIVVEDTVNNLSSTGSDRLTVAVAPATLGQFAWNLTSPQTNGVPFSGSNTLIAQDDWGNTLPTFSADTINVTVTASLSALPAAVSGLGTLRNNVLNRPTDFGLGVANLTALGMTYTGIGGTGTFTATSAVGSKSGSSDSVVVSNPAPTLTTVLPVKASRGQTLNVALSGSNFRAGVTTVSLGPGITVTSVTVNTPAQITAGITITGAAALGPRDVTVTNPAPGGGAATSAGSFTVENFPTILGLAPPNGLGGQTLDVVVHGRNFIDGISSVLINASDISRNSATVTSDTTILMNITILPVAQNGIRDVFVNNSGSYGGFSNSAGFTVGSNPKPSIASVQPTSLRRLETGALIVRGSNFYGTITNVDLGPGITINNAAIDSATQMHINATVTDSAAAGVRPIIVTNRPPGGGSDTLKGVFQILNPDPTLTGLSVQNGFRLQTIFMTLTGTGFISGTTSVDFGDSITVTSTIIENQTQLRVNLFIDSNAVLGPRNIVLANLAPGGGADTLKSAFTVSNPMPTVTAIAPDSAQVKSSPLVLTVTGTNFVPGSAMRFGALSLTTTLVSRSRLTATIPASELDTARSFSVDVITPTPGGGTSNSKTFNVQNLKPTLTGIAPASSARLQTLDVVFTGTNFVPGVSTVGFTDNDVRVNTVTVNSATKLTANLFVTAAAAIGPHNVTVVNPAPGGGVSAVQVFTVGSNPVPTLTTVAPSTGNRLAEMDVTFTGTNFIDGISSVSFGQGIAVSDVVVVNSTQMKAKIAIGVNANAGPRPVEINNSAPGGGRATLANGFVVINPVPTLTAISPSNGQQLQTLNVVFNGSGFIAGVSVVNMGIGITVNQQTVVSDSQTTANLTITQNALTGPRDVWITNLTPGGGTTVLSNGFVVGNNPSPKLTSITPGAGVRLEVLNVVFRGEDFLSGTSTVDFGPDISVRSITVDSATRLTANVSIGPAAHTGLRTVYITNAAPGGGQDSLVAAFAVTNPIPTLVSATPPAANLSQTLNVVLRGSRFIAGATTVDFGSGITVNSVTVDSSTKIITNVSVASAAAIGARTIVVRNPVPGGGSSSSVAFAVNLAEPPVPTLRTPANGATNLPTTLTLRWDSAAGATGYHVQLSENSLFLSTAVDDSMLKAPSRSVGPLVNNRTYYWHVRAKNGGGTSTWSSTASFTPAYPTVFNLINTVSFPTLSGPSEYTPSDYRIVGLPGNGTSVVGNFLNGSQGTDWQLYRDNGSATSYFVAYDGSLTFVFSTGKAYWLIKRSTWSVNVSVAAAPLDPSGAVSVPLQRGWNMITNPFPLDVPWSAVQSVNGQVASNPLWAFSGTSGFQQSTVMQAYVGYYFFNADTATVLKIPYGGTSGVLKQADSVDDGGWMVDIAVVSGVYAERSASFGVAQDASEGLDYHDYRKPRAMGNIPGVTFRRPDLDPVFPAFATDVRLPDQKLTRWPVEVHAERNTPSSLHFSGISGVPSDLEVYLVDVARSTYTDLRRDAEYPFRSVTDVSNFTVLVGGHEAMATELSTVLPREFGLANNFPNPFNPTTTIPVSIPATAEVTLKIYNILGEEIRTLHTGVLEGGRHWFTWDGRNEAGRGVATGVYLTRLTTPAGGNHVLKMLLMK